MLIRGLSSRISLLRRSSTVPSSGSSSAKGSSSLSSSSANSMLFVISASGLLACAFLPFDFGSSRYETTSLKLGPSFARLRRMRVLSLPFIGPDASMILARIASTSFPVSSHSCCSAFRVSLHRSLSVTSSSSSSSGSSSRSSGSASSSGVCEPLLCLLGKLLLCVNKY